MANGYVVALGITLLLIAILGYIVPISVTLADTTVNLTIPKVVAFCNSGFGQLSQMLPQVVMVCSEYNNFLIGIYGAGVIGVILIIVGEVVSEGRKTSDTNSLEIIKERYAKGEITNEEYRRMKKELGDDGDEDYTQDGVTYKKD